MILTALAKGIEMIIPRIPIVCEPIMTTRTTVTGCKFTIRATTIGTINRASKIWANE